MPTHSPSLPATAPPEPTGNRPAASATSHFAKSRAEELSLIELAGAMLASDDTQRLPKAAELLVRGCQRRMMDVARNRRRLKKEDAEDVVQDTFLRFLTAWSPHVEDAAAYLFTTFYHRCNDFHNANAAALQLHVPLDDTPDDAYRHPSLELPADLATTDPMRLAQWRRVMADVDQVLLAQTPGRVAVMLLDAQGYSDKEIAMQLNISEAAVGDRRYRVLKTLRAIYQDLFKDPSHD